MSSGDLLTKKARFYYWFVKFFHRFLLFLFPRQMKLNKAPKRILLANWGSLGDVVLSVNVIAEVKLAFPDCQIGFITSEQGKEACQALTSIQWIHTANYFLKPGLKRRQKIVSFLRFLWIEQSKIAREIAPIGYDCAIELRPFFPNLIPVFWKARIPVRIGFLASGNETLLTSSIPCFTDRYLPYSYQTLLTLLGVKNRRRSSLLNQLNLTNSTLLAKKPYLLFHLCSSESSKELPLDLWKELYQQCKEWGFTVYFTGKGEREGQIIEQISSQPDENLCNRLNWNELVRHIQECQGLVSVDSVPIHLAAALKIPTLALFVSTPFPLLWKPTLPSTTALGIERPVNLEDALSVIRNWQSSILVGKNSELIYTDREMQ